MRNLVLGGAGLLGSALVEILSAHGHEVDVLDRRTGCDLRYVDAKPFEESDRVWFLAWDAGGAKYLGAAGTQHEQFKHNCELSANVFDMLAKTGKPFLFATSQLAGQLNAYGLTKLMAEQWAISLGGKIARLWNVFGWERPDIRSHAVADFVLSGLVNRRIKCLTRGCERRRFLYKSDGAAALLELFDGSAKVADIAGTEWINIRSVAEEVARQLSVMVEFGELDGTEVMLDPSKLLTTWRPAVSIEEGIASVIAEARAYLQSRNIGVLPPG